MGGGKGSSPKMPAPIDEGKVTGEYLFGKGFTSYQGITDPRLQDRLLGAESTYRPEYTALELADIGVMARGLEEREVADPRYTQAQERISELQAELAKTPKTISTTTQIGKGRFRGRSSRSNTVTKPNPKRAELEREIASQQERLSGLSPTKMQAATPGLFDLLEEQSRRAGVLQREELQLQRESDVGALQEFAPQVVEAYRAADPYSTRLADEATAQAMDPSLRNQGKSFINSKIEAASAAELALMSSGLDDINAKREAASAAERELNKVGMSLSDLNPTEQEAILSGRGMEFAASTGELTALEKRRAQQSSRQASVARGRGMDQSAVYGEMEARMAEELNKREREIALGSSLLGQQANMRLSRLGQGASILTQAEAMNAQRRAEQLQRQQFGASTLGQSEAMSAQRRAEQLQRIQLGSGLIGQANQQLQSAFGMNRQIAGDVGMTILGRPSSAIGLGGSVLGQAQAGAAGPMGPQLFDPNVGINMALQQRGQNITFQGMQAQAQATNSAGMMSALGSLGGSLLGASATGTVGSAAIAAI
jgi:hypothetical protein